MSDESEIAPRAAYAACATCPLWAPITGRVNPCVQGKGRDQADVVLVGEAPGETEVVLRKPFCGPSGKLLDRLLGEVEIDRDDIYVTNTCLCHPAHNAKPSALAVKACQARLFEEIRQRRPRIVVVTGDTALKAFGVDEKISKCRGRERWISVEQLQAALHKGRRKRDLGDLHFDPDWRDGGFYLLPTWHPAYALRSPDKFPDMQHDFKRLVTLLGQEPAVARTLPDVEVIVGDNATQTLDWLAVIGQQPTVAADIESTSKDVITDTLLTLAYAWRHGNGIRALVIPADLARDPGVCAGLRALHARPTRFVWWNGKFDRKWYARHLGITVRIDGDGMLAHYALDERRGIHGLKERASDDLGADDYEDEIKGYVGKGKHVNYGNIPFDKLVRYTAEDVGMTLMLTEDYEAQLAAEPKIEWVYRHVLLPASEVLSDMELDGAAVDVDALRALETDFRALLDGYTQRIYTALGHEFNLKSYSQKVQVLYGDGVRVQYPSANTRSAVGLPSLNLPVILGEKHTPATGKDACDKLLQRIANTGNPRAEELLRALRNYTLDEQLDKTYIRKLPTVVHPDRRLRTNFNLHTVRSGRLSSSDPTNIQNIPTRREEGRRIKNAFVAGEWDDFPCVLGELDFSQAELRTAAFLSREPALMQVYLEGRDFHHEVALRILGDADLAKKLRPYIKTFNFAILYGAEPNMLAILLNDTALEVETRTGEPQARWETAQVKQLYDEFWQQFPVFAAWANEQKQLALTQGYVESYFGRRRRFPLITRETWRDAQKEAVNHPVQSTAAEFTTLGMIETHQWLRQADHAARMWPALVEYLHGHIPGRIVATVHDSLLIECIRGAERYTLWHAARILEAIPGKHGIDIPFLVDAKVGDRWGSLEALNVHTPDYTPEEVKAA